MNDAPIGVIDSGVGGLTVVKALQEQLPNESILYYGDTARVPYGEKSTATIRMFAQECAEFLGGKGIKLLVIACHTATAHALQWLQEELPIPVIGVIEPAVSAACRLSESGRIGVIATRQTIASKSYPLMLVRERPDVTVWTAACPLLVPFAEEALWDHPAAVAIVKMYLKPMNTTGCDTLVLGCTHYPMLSNAIQKVVGPRVTLIDSSRFCAEAVRAVLDTYQLQSSPDTTQEHAFFVSDDPARFAALGSRFLRQSLEKVAHVVGNR